MKCQKCNAENEEWAKHCVFCKTPFFEPSPESSLPGKDIPCFERNSCPPLSCVDIGHFIRKHLFLSLLIILIITFFARNNYRSVRDIDPLVLSAPIQYELSSHQIIRFERNGYKYEVTPLFGYRIHGLIVSKLDYKAFSIQKADKVFPMDLCMIWGKDVSSQVYRSSALRFSQDCRWCWAQWSGGIKFDMNELSNNHLLINDNALEKKAQSLMAGDQVRIEGKLVNVKAKLISQRGRFDPPEYSWNSSTSRTDSGAGACEVIYVEGITILKKANQFWRLLFQISLYGILFSVILYLFGFFYVLRKK